MSHISMQFLQAIGGDGASAVEAQVNAILEAELERHANRLLDIYEDDREWTAAVDGRPVIGRAFSGARKEIRITFVQEALQLAVRELGRILSRSIDRNQDVTPEEDWFNKPEVKGSVQIFYGGLNKPIREITGVGSIERFLPGDVVILAPTYPTNVYANAKKYGSRGFMAKAASAIRRKMGVNKRSSPLRVSAERSKAAFYAQSRKSAYRGYRFAKNGTKAGLPIDITVPWVGADSAWTIAIRYRLTRRTQNYGRK